MMKDHKVRDKDEEKYLNSLLFTIETLKNKLLQRIKDFLKEFKEFGNQFIYDGIVLLF